MNNQSNELRLQKERFLYITINGQPFNIRLPRTRWYYELQEKVGNTGRTSRNSTEYMDEMFKGTIVYPTEIAERGMGYFDENDDLKTPEALIKEIEKFIDHESSIETARERARQNKDYWCSMYAKGELSYECLNALNIAGYHEATAARDLWQNEWQKQEKEADKDHAEILETVGEIIAEVLMVCESLAYANNQLRDEQFIGASAGAFGLMARALNKANDLINEIDY